MDAPKDLPLEREDRARMPGRAGAPRPGKASVRVCAPARRRGGSRARVEGLRPGRVGVGDRFVLVSAAREAGPEPAGDDRLRDELARYRRVFDDDLCGAVVAAADSRVVACNAEFARIAGFPSPQAAVGVELDRLEPEPGEWAARVDRLRRKEDAAEPGELELVRRDGTRVRVVVRLAADFDAGGGPLEYRGYLVDVTRRAVREEAPRPDGERPRPLEPATGDVAWEGDPGTGRISWNDASPRRFRHCPDEVRPSPERRVERVRPDDRERVAAGMRQAAAGVAEGWTDEHRFPRGDGTRATVHDPARVTRDARGEPMRVAGWRVDVTERERGEEGQRFLAHAGAVLGSSLDARATAARLARLCVPALADFCTLDVVEEDGEVRRAAVAHLRQAREHLLDRHARLAPGASAGASPVARVARTGEPVLCAECDAAALAALDASLGDGHARRLGTRSYMLVPVAARGRVVAVLTLGLARPGRRYGPADLALAGELAHRGALALENARLYETAQHALRAREEVLGLVSHDLRTPLSTIVSTAMLLSDVILERREDPRRWLDVIRRAADQMSSLVDDLLDVSSMEAGRFEVAPTRQDLAALLRECCEQLRPLSQRQGLVLECPAGRGLPPASFDARQLRRVIWNLMANALKFSPPGGTVRLRAEEAAGEVRVAVSDEGAGIPDEQRRHIFERFWKADRTDRRGAGLGLAIARGIVEAHGGRMWVESRVGEGSTFWFSLPLPRAEGVGAPGAPPSSATADGAEAGRPGPGEESPEACHA